MDIRRINKISPIRLKSVNSGKAFIFDGEKTGCTNPCIRVRMPNRLEEIILSDMPYESRNKDIFAVDLTDGNLFLADGDAMVIPLYNSCFAMENI